MLVAETVLCALTIVNNGQVRAVAPDWTDPTIYGTPVNLGAPVNTAGSEYQLNLSNDELTLIFGSGDTRHWGSPRPGSGPTGDLWITTRSSRSEPWAEPVRMGPEINTSSMNESSPWLSSDGLELYITRLDSANVHTLWVSMRSSVADPWPIPQKLPPHILSGGVWCPCLSQDNLTLYYMNLINSGSVYVTTRASRSAAWGTPTPLGPEVNTSLWEFNPWLSPDGLSLLFVRGAGTSDADLWFSTRETLGSPWRQAVKLPAPVNLPSPSADFAPWLPPDMTMLYFQSNRPGGLGEHDLWQVPILAPADFDRDRDVDGDDLKTFLACATGPSIPYDLAALPPGCAVTPTGQIIPPDFDKDVDVDQDDFGVWQRCFSGTGKPADPDCAE